MTVCQGDKIKNTGQKECNSQNLDLAVNKGLNPVVRIYSFMAETK